MLPTTSAKFARLALVSFLMVFTSLMAFCQETRKLEVKLDTENSKEIFLSLIGPNIDPFAILEVRDEQSKIVYYIDPYEVTIAPDYSKIGLYELPIGKYTIRMYTKNWSAQQEFELR